MHPQILSILALAPVAKLLPYVEAHASIWHPSMWGFNVTQQTFSYDNRPVSPLQDYTFDQWWFHGHLDYPPHAEDVFELPAGTNVTTEIACNKGATSYIASSEGGDIRSGDDPCPGSDPSEYHTTGIDDVKGCALAIAYKSNVSDVNPEDFTVFSVNQTCVWTRFTDFAVPERMPLCPDGGCICAWFWIHSPDSGGEQNYMNGFQCNITGSTSTAPLAAAQLPRRCGTDTDNNKPDPSIANCTYGAKQPFYWLQTERNNMFEGYYSPPFYTDLYNFVDGAQNDIFNDSYHSIPVPSEDQTQLPSLNIIVSGQTFRVPDVSQVLANSSLVELMQSAEASATVYSANAAAATGSPTSPSVSVSSTATSSESQASSMQAVGVCKSKRSYYRDASEAFVTTNRSQLSFTQRLGLGTYEKRRSMYQDGSTTDVLRSSLWGFW